MANNVVRERRGKQQWLWFLLIPYIATLWPAFYASARPEFFGIPFFYWYQFLWVILSALLTGIIYLLVR
jgi:hypothetical protein